MSSRPSAPSRLSFWPLLNTLVACVAAGLMLSSFLYDLKVATGLLTPAEEARSSCGDTPAQWRALYVG